MAEQKASPAVAIKSIGCRTNQEEMVTLSASLVQQGYRLVENAAEAAVIVVNTCSVTAATESKTRRLLHALAAQAPMARILVTGCLAQQKPDELAKVSGVSWVVGNGCKHLIDSILQHHCRGIYRTSLQEAAELTMSRTPPPPNGPAMLRTRYPVKIQEGCDFRCSYCVVPLLRGPSRSAPFDTIIAACKQSVEAGYKEIVLTGTHIGQFNDRGRRLIDLLDRLAAANGDFRIRLSSLDPRDCSETLINLIGSAEKLCDHLHVSLQSCSEPVLKAMKRHVPATIDLLDRLEGFRERFPLAGLGADLIAGFPGETETMFEETCRRIERINLSYAHVFRFSPRPGTPAAASASQVREAVKTARSAYLRTIVERSRALFLKRIQQSSQRIIVESGSPVRGITSNYIHVEIPDCTLEHNTWLDVTITGLLRGRYCSAQPVLYKVA
ncbi:MAG: tRNA (N(6)-L-threonylcarbamoyladenosine(37)-C(2))-methylthiotransferase MtaB [Chitinispirillaceae bacterium]|nr:tRNA (N(6)-L-threonylcarbamoyladenosine(37)-C(2))-methylthiotransferase MtaB [Chitinispirillaceae bacterium]